MKNLIILSLLLSIIVGICSCTEKEDPIQTVKDKLVGTWVTRDYPPGTIFRDSLILRQDNSMRLASFRSLVVFSLNRGADTITFTQTMPRRLTESYAFRLVDDRTLRMIGYLRINAMDPPRDMYFTKL